VRDNGIGIDPAVLPEVFDLFTQSSQLNGRGQTGLGIGLALAKTPGADARRRGAGTTVMDRERASEFTVLLPRQTGAGAAAATAAAGLAEAVGTRGAVGDRGAPDTGRRRQLRCT